MLLWRTHPLSENSFLSSAISPETKKFYAFRAPLINPHTHWTTSGRVYKEGSPKQFHQKRGDAPMVDLTTSHIRKLFEQQVRELTARTLLDKEDLFDFQLSGGWL